MMQQAFLSLCAVEFARIIRNPSQIVALLAQAILMFVLIRFGMAADAEAQPALPALLLGALTISMLHLSSCMFDDDAHHGRIAHWHYSPLSFEWILLIKFLLMLLCYALPLAGIFSLLLMMQGQGGSATGYCIIFLCASSAIIACGMLSGAVKLLFDQHQTIGMLLMLPFLTSVMIFCASALGQGEQLLLPMVLAIGFPLCTILLSAIMLRRSY
jgi:ABC-type transport system involved in cytochrome c biogenesis permease component